MRWILLFCFLLLSFSSLSQSICGTVFQPDSTSSISEVGILLIKDRTEIIRQIVNLEDGTYCLRDLSPGAYVLKFEHLDFTYHSLSVVVAEEDIIYNPLMTPDQPELKGLKYLIRLRRAKKRRLRASDK